MDDQVGSGSDDLFFDSRASEIKVRQVLGYNGFIPKHLAKRAAQLSIGPGNKNAHDVKVEVKYEFEVDFSLNLFGS